MNRYLNILLLFITIMIVFSSCKKKYDNPYDDPALDPPPGSATPSLSDPTNFAYLHEKIFAPVCANSGCHDGTFEPDFRTISSAYNTLVYAPVITNDAAGTFTYRVEPGNSAKSLLHERLTNFIPNTSGLMPLAVDPDSDWNQKDQTYITYIKNWIDAGAKDLFGNVPSLKKKEMKLENDK